MADHGRPVPMAMTYVQSTVEVGLGLAVEVVADFL